MQLSTNGATANVVHHDLDLHFQGHYFLNVTISIYQRISQMAIGSRIIPADLQSSGLGQKQFLLSPKYCFLFQLFQVKLKTRIVSFLANCLINFESITDYDRDA